MDVTALNVNDSIHVSDLKLAPGLAIKTDPALAVASVVLPESEEAAATPAEGAAEGEAAAPAADAAPAAKGADAKAAAPKADAKGGDKKK